MGLSLKGIVRGVSRVAGNVGAAVKKAAGQAGTIAKPIASVASFIPGPHQLITTGLSLLPTPKPRPAAHVQLPAPRPMPVLIAEPTPAPAPIVRGGQILTKTAPAAPRTVVRPAPRVLPSPRPVRASAGQLGGFLSPRFALLRLQLSARRR